MTKEDSQAPTISIVIPTKNVIAGVTLTVKDNQLLFNEDVAASWTDDYTTACTVELSLTTGENADPKPVKTGDILKDAGKLTITVADEFQNKSSGEITLTAVAVYGLENLSQLQLKVDEEINLLQGLTIAEGLTLQKVEIVQDGVHTVIDNPNAFTPEYPGSINLILTVARPDGGTIEVEINGLNIKSLEFCGIDITNIDPESLVPEVEV